MVLIVSLPLSVILADRKDRTLCQAEIVHLPVRIDGSPQVLLGSLDLLGAELLRPAINGRSVDHHAALFQEIDDILARRRITQIPAHGTKDDLTWKPVMLER